MTDQLPATIDAATLEVQLHQAQILAEARSALPTAYQKNPGAILLAQEWGAVHGLPTLTVLQTVSFVDGRPVIDASMQRALAQRAGYQVVPTEISAQSATVEVRRDGKVLGSSTYTIDDAKTAGLLGKANWKNHPKNMLVARATTNAIRWYAPEITMGMYTHDELEDVNTPNPAPVPPIPPTTTAATADTDDGVEDAEVVEPHDDGDDGGLQLLLTTVKGLDTDTKNQFRDHVADQGWPKKPKDMTPAQIADALKWIEANA